MHHFLTISWLLLNNLLNPSVEEALLILCKSAGEQSLSPFLSFPLVQLLSQPTSTLLFGSHDQISSNQKMAATLLKLCDSTQVSRVIEMTTSSCSGQYSLFVSTAQKYVSITDDPDKVISWLTSLTKNLGGSKSPSGASDHLVVVVATILLKYCNTECSDSVIESSLQALCSIAKSDPTAVSCCNARMIIMLRFEHIYTESFHSTILPLPNFNHDSSWIQTSSALFHSNSSHTQASFHSSEQHYYYSRENPLPPSHSHSTDWKSLATSRPSLPTCSRVPVSSSSLCTDQNCHQRGCFGPSRSNQGYLHYKVCRNDYA